METYKASVYPPTLVPALPAGPKWISVLSKVVAATHDDCHSLVNDTRRNERGKNIHFCCSSRQTARRYNPIPPGAAEKAK